MNRNDFEDVRNRKGIPSDALDTGWRLRKYRRRQIFCEGYELVITDASAKDPSLKARALDFFDLPHSYDRQKYRELFLEAIREIDLDGKLEKELRSDNPDTLPNWRSL